MRICTPFLIAAIAGLSTAYTATAAPFYADGAQRLELKNLAATVIVVPEARDTIDIKVRYGRAKIPTLMVSKHGETTVLNGQIALPTSGHGFNMTISIVDDNGATSGRVTIPGAGMVNIKDLPVVYVRVPNDVHIQDNALIFGQIGPSQSVELTSCGKGNWTIANVTGNLNIIGCGPADITANAANNGIITSTSSGTIAVKTLNYLKANLTGSGSLNITNVTNLDLQNQGSGDVELGKVGRATLKLGGSGDLAIKSIDNGFSLTNYGSSDVDITSINGAVTIDMSGSGDVSMSKGQISDMTIKGYGSGDVYFGGQTNTVTVDSYGSGDVSVVRATGKVVTRVRGSGDMDIGH